MLDNNKISFNREVISAYLEGNLSEIESSKIEKIMEENPFYKDAIEGFNTTLLFGDHLRRLEQKKEYYYGSKPYMFYSLFCFLSLVLGAVFITSVPKSQKYKVGVDLTKVKSANSQVNHFKSLEQDNFIKESLDLMKEHSSNKLAELIKREVSDNNKQKNFNYKPKQLEFIKIDVNPKPMLPLVDSSLKRIETVKVPLISMHGFTIINYSKMSTSNEFDQSMLTYTGVPANVESNNSNNEVEFSQNIRVKNISYQTYLSSIQFNFSKGKYKQALKGYKKVLEQYPNDLNAHFYSGLCYYNINEYLKALQHFNVVEVHEYSTFRQEGEWYKALTLYKLGKIEKTINILDKIILQGDFYKKNAEKFRNELK